MNIKILANMIVLFLISSFTVIAMEENREENTQEKKKTDPHYFQAHFKSTSPAFKEYQVNSPFFRDKTHPMVPLFHPLDPEGIKTPLTIHIPPEASSGLPEIIRSRIEDSKIEVNTSLNIVISAQTIPLSWKKQPIFLHPQHATAGPLSSPTGSDWLMQKATVGVFYSDSQSVHFSEHQPNEFVENRCFTVHPEGSDSPEDQKEGKLIFGKAFPVEGIEPNVSQSIWSAVFVNSTEKNLKESKVERVFVTLHWLLNEDQFKNLSDILIANPKTKVTPLIKSIREDNYFKQFNHVYKMEPLLNGMGSKVDDLERCNIDISPRLLEVVTASRVSTSYFSWIWPKKEINITDCRQDDDHN